MGTLSHGGDVGASWYVIRTLRKELAKPSREEWVERARKLYEPGDIRPIDVVSLIHEVRAEYDPDKRFPAE